MSEINILYSHITDVYNSSIPKRIGTYVITHTIDNIHAEKYVGATKNLFNRMCGHYNKEIIYIDLFITDDIELAESLERILIELIEPATNKIIPPLSNKDKEIMNELLRNTDIKKYTSNNIVKIGCRYLKCVNKNESILLKYNDQINKTFYIRSVIIVGGSPLVTIPRDFGFKKGESVLVERVDENSCKITKVEYVKK